MSEDKSYTFIFSFDVLQNKANYGLLLPTAVSPV